MCSQSCALVRQKKSACAAKLPSAGYLAERLQLRVGGVGV